MKAILSTLLFCLYCFAAQAQSPLRFIGTAGVSDRLGQEYAGYWDNRVAIEQQYHGFVLHGMEQPLTIPVVFHFVLPDSVSIGAEQINCQMASLNEDFGGQTFLEESVADLALSFYDSITLAGRLDMFGRAASNSGISFCIAQTDAQGNAATGIDFASAPAKIWTWDDAVKSTETGGLSAWDTQQYLNIWVCVLADSVSGYAQMPGGPPDNDGIVVDYRFFGCGGTARAPYQKGKTLTHLIGNYLNLYDLWSYTERCRDDNVDDTPVHNAPNTGGDHFRHISTCDGFPMEMTMNFMDNMDDSCQYLFTKGQAKRMQAVLAENGWRAALSQWQSSRIGCTHTLLTENMLPPGMRTAERQETEAKKATILFSIVPNPARTQLTVSVRTQTELAATVRITTGTGMEIYNTRRLFQEGANTLSLDCSQWPRGIYWASLVTDNKPFAQVLIIE